MRNSSNLLAAVLASVVAAGCGAPAIAPGASPTVAAKIAGGTVTIRMQGDWGKPIDGGQTVTTANGGMLSASMYDRVVAVAGDSSKLVPYIAAAWATTPTSVTV